MKCKVVTCHPSMAEAKVNGAIKEIETLGATIIGIDTTSDSANGDMVFTISYEDPMLTEVMPSHIGGSH